MRRCGSGGAKANGPGLPPPPNAGFSDQIGEGAKVAWRFGDNSQRCGKGEKVGAEGRGWHGEEGECERSEPAGAPAPPAAAAGWRGEGHVRPDDVPHGVAPGRGAGPNDRADPPRPRAPPPPRGGGGLVHFDLQVVGLPTPTYPNGLVAFVLGVWDKVSVGWLVGAVQCWIFRHETTSDAPIGRTWLPCGDCHITWLASKQKGHMTGFSDWTGWAGRFLGDL